jgi:hypothetical protein
MLNEDTKVKYYHVLSRTATSMLLSAKLDTARFRMSNICIYSSIDWMRSIDEHSQ